MYISIREEDGAIHAHLNEPGNVAQFHVQLVDKEEAMDAVTSDPIEGGTIDGVRRDGDHFFIAPNWIRLQAGDLAADAEWVRGFEGMLAYAESKGWIDGATGDVRAHVA